MKLTAVTSNIKTVRHGDPEFTIRDGIMLCNRAGFEIDAKCPNEYRQIIQACLEYGWLKPVAFMTRQEHFMEKLAE
jgi:hypothetical protein